MRQYWWESAISNEVTVRQLKWVNAPVNFRWPAGQRQSSSGLQIQTGAGKSYTILFFRNSVESLRLKNNSP